jgi:GNAT superfamily N-acetyltransferase
MSDIEFRVVAFDAPEAVEMIEELQSEYVTRYGSGDETPVEPAEFAPPRGIFVIASDAGHPVGCAGVRITEPGLGELKRMYVRHSARRRGIARQLLDRMENEARALGATRLRLETGARQPEALALYISAGYSDAEPFGHYADYPLSHHLAKAL